jgi:hypothetical protein
MNPRILAKSIYTGDRGCKAFVYDQAMRELRIQIDCISVLRPGTEVWDFYTEGDIEDGWIVFRRVDELSMEPPGATPNDFFNGISIEDCPNSPERYRMVISIDSIDDSGKTTEVTIRGFVNDAHLEDSNGQEVSNGIR